MMKKNYILTLIFTFLILGCISNNKPKNEETSTKPKLESKKEKRKKTTKEAKLKQNKNKEIILATDNWAPFYSPKLESNGFFTEVVKTAFKRVGYNCKIKFVPWKRALEQSKTGHYHGLLGAFFKKSREEFYTYSDSVYKTNMVFFSLKEKNIKFKKLEDLSKYKVGVTRGYHYSKEFDSAINIQKEEVSKLEQNIYKLLNNRIDLFVDSREVVLWLLKTKFTKESKLIKIINPALANKDLYITISKKVKNHKEIIKQFNKGLKEIKQDGSYQKIIERHFKKVQCSMAK